MKLVNTQPVIDILFWKKCFQIKLENLKLEQNPIEIFGVSECSKLQFENLRLKFDENSFEKDQYEIIEGNLHQVKFTGHLIILNRLIDFDEFQQGLLDQKQFKLESFLLLVYVDHKSYSITYSFIQKQIKSSQLQSFQITYNKQNYLLIEPQDFNEQDIIDSKGLMINKEKCLYVDPINTNCLSYLTFNFLDLSLIKKEIIFIKSQLLSLKQNQVYYILLQPLQEVTQFEYKYKLIKNKIQLNLKESLCQEEIIQQQIQLNIKLINWRINPKYNFNLYPQMKVLILGMGTLGCNFANLLVSYGFLNFSLIDSGKVSYSNLGRQSLYNTDHFDQDQNALFKTKAAEIQLKKLNPALNIITYEIWMPMPGHFLSEENFKTQKDNLFILEKEILNCDLVFSCLDSREGRYFPCLLSSLYQKTNLSVGIGFDSFIAILQGIILKESIQQKTGCYFCSDYMEPKDTLSGWTLDQQCTVTKPGVSPFACGASIELLDQFLQKSNKNFTSCVTGSLGEKFSINQIENWQYQSCICCSEKILQEYTKNKEDFLYKVLKDSKIVQKIVKENSEEECSGVEEIEIIELD